MAEQTERDPFYVGYLPLPKAIKRFIVPWLVGNIVLAIGIAAVVASQHREPGDGVWGTGQSVKVEGWLELDPYPVLHGVDREIYLPVEIGKVGSQERINEFERGLAIITGFVIKRDGRNVIEIDDSAKYPVLNYTVDIPTYNAETLPDNALESVVTYSRTIRALRVQQDLGTHTLRGEIVDPKCYLGVMQPGDGKTHKVCATLCIKGGIPPMLLVRDKQGETAAYLLTDVDGNAFPASHHEYIADPIEVTGQVVRDGDLLILRADLDSIRRLEQ
ncbi:MAG: hypothetical protein KTR15_01040 [Phycisphaeraceae bacterium]|nr:hypothetical protein [Phycisphaeraceae bacterium]